MYKFSPIQDGDTVNVTVITEKGSVGTYHYNTYDSDYTKDDAITKAIEEVKRKD